MISVWQDCNINPDIVETLYSEKKGRELRYLKQFYSNAAGDIGAELEQSRDFILDVQADGIID